MNAGELKVDQATTLVTIEGLTTMMGKEVQANTRIAASLNDDTDFGPTNHNKVARIMKSMGLKGFMKRRRCITTRRKPGHRVMSDKVSGLPLEGVWEMPARYIGKNWEVLTATQGTR